MAQFTRVQLTVYVCVPRLFISSMPHWVHIPGSCARMHHLNSDTHHHNHHVQLLFNALETKGRHRDSKGGSQISWPLSSLDHTDFRINRPQLEPSTSVMCSTAGPDRGRKWKTKDKDGNNGRGVLQWQGFGWDSIFTYQGMK